MKELELLVPEIKVVVPKERKLKPYKVISKSPTPGGAVMRIGHWRLEDKFTQDYVENVGVTEVVASFLLRHSIDIMIFQEWLAVGFFYRKRDLFSVFKKAILYIKKTFPLL